MALEGQWCGKNCMKLLMVKVLTKASATNSYAGLVCAS